MSMQSATADTRHPGGSQGEVLPRRYRFDVDEYYAMARAGIFTEDDRVELLDGEIIEMSPIGRRHAQCVDRLNRVFSRRCADRAVVRVQNPIRLARRSEPQSPTDPRSRRCRGGRHRGGVSRAGTRPALVQLRGATRSGSSSTCTRRPSSVSSTCTRRRAGT